MPYDDNQLNEALDIVSANPRWQDEAKRRELIREVAVLAKQEPDPEIAQRLIPALWEKAKGGMMQQAGDFVARGAEEVVKSIPAAGGAAAFAVSDAVNLTESGSGKRLYRGGANLIDGAVQRTKKALSGEVIDGDTPIIGPLGKVIAAVVPGESKQKARDEALGALKDDLDKGLHPDGLERWFAGEFDDGSEDPDEETKEWITGLTRGLAKKAVEADHMGEADPERVRAWLESDRNPLFMDSDIPGELGPRALLADYVATGDPSSWDAFKARVSETDSQRATRLQRYAAEGEARATVGAMPDGIMKDLIERSFDMQTSPIDLASSALPLLRGAAALKAARAGAKAGTVAGGVIKGMGEEFVQEAATEALSDPNASTGQIIEAGALGAVGSGAVQGGMGLAGGVMRLAQGTPEAAADDPAPPAKPMLVLRRDDGSQIAAVPFDPANEQEERQKLATQASETDIIVVESVDENATKETEAADAKPGNAPDTLPVVADSADSGVMQSVMDLLTESTLPKRQWPASPSDAWQSFKRLVGRVVSTPVGLVVRIKPGHFGALVSKKPQDGKPKGFVYGFNSPAEGRAALEAGSVNDKQVAGYEAERAAMVESVPDILSAPDVVLRPKGDSTKLLFFKGSVPGTSDSRVVVTMDTKTGELGFLSVHPKNIKEGFLSQHDIIYMRPKDGNAAPDGGSASTPVSKAPSAASQTPTQASSKLPAPQPESGGGPGASSLNEWGKTRFGERLRADDRLRQAWRDSMAPNNYRKETWEEWQERANGFIAEHGIEGAYALLQDPDSPLSISDRPFLGMQLILSIDKATRQAEAKGDTARAEMLDDLNHELQQQVDAMAHKAGLELSTFAAWTHMSADGVMRSFERKLDEAREKDMGAKIGKPEDIAAKVKAEADDQRETVISEALGESELEQLAEMQRKIAELRQQLEQAKAEAEAAKQATAQAQTPAEAAQAEQAVEKTTRRVKQTQGKLKDAEARQKEKAKQAGKPRPPGEKKPRVINPAEIAWKWIDRLMFNHVFGGPRPAQDQSQLQQVIEDYLKAETGKLPDINTQLRAAGVPPEVAVELQRMLDMQRQHAADMAKLRANEALNNQVQSRVDNLLQNLVFGGPPKPTRKSDLSQAVEDYLKAETGKLPDLQGQLKALGVDPAKALELQRMLDMQRQHAADMAKLKANQALNKQVQNRINDLLQKHVFGGPSKPQVVGDLARFIREYVKADAAQMPDLLAQLQGLGIDPARAAELQRMLDMERQSIAEIARERAIQNLVKQITPKTALPKTRERIPRFLKKLMEAYELGALDRDEFLDAYAEAFELPQMDKAQRDRVAALIKKQREAPEGWIKQQATTELMDELAKFKGSSAFDTGTAFWYANILSGISTQGVNLTGSAWHLGLRTLSIMGSHHPELTWHFFRGMFRGAQRGLLEAVATLRDGTVPYKGNLQFTQGQVLELVHTNDAGRFRDRVFQQMKTVVTGGEGSWTRAKAFAAFGKIVFRALAAGDAFFYHSAREAKAGLEAARYARDQVAINGGSFRGYLAEQLNHGITQWEQAMEQAKQETKDAGMTPKSGDLERRAWEILEAGRPAELTEAANRFGLWVTYTHKPEGTMGQIAKSLNELHHNFTLATPWGEIRLLTPVIPFVNIIANVTGSAIDFTPFGIWRGLKGKTILPHKGQVEFSPWEARQRVISGTMGTMGVGLLWMLAESLAGGNDDEVPFMIYGMGPSTKARREQMPKGWKPYTLKIGDTYWSYSETPLAIALSVAGGLLDKKRYGSSTVPVAAGGYIMSIFGGAMLKTGMLSSVDDIFSMLSGEKPMTPVVTRTVTGLIPAQGLLRDISELMHGEKIDDTTLAAAFFKDIPIVRGWVGKAPLNVFGEPVQLDVMQRLPVIKRLVTMQGEDPETLWLARQKLWIPGMDNQIAVGSYLPEKIQQSLQEARRDKLGSMAANVLSHEERYKLVQLAGPEIRRVVKAVRAEVEKNPDVPREYIQNYLNGRIVGARRVAMMQLLGLK